MSSLRTQDIVEILEGKKKTQKTCYRGYCTASYTPSIIDTALKRQTGIVVQNYNPRAVEEEGRAVTKRSKKDSEFKKYLKKYLKDDD